MAKDPIRKSPTTVTDPGEVEVKIRERACVLYEARGREDGHDLEDWLRARKQSRRRRHNFAACPSFNLAFWGFPASMFGRTVPVGVPQRLLSEPRASRLLGKLNL